MSRPTPARRTSTHVNMFSPQRFSEVRDLSFVRMHADTTFADLGGNASVARIDGAAASFVNTAFADCAASPPHALITARGGRAAVWLQDVRFPNSSDAAALRSEGDAAFYVAGALPEGAELFDAAAGAQAPPDIVAEQPAGIAFATEAEINPLREVRRRRLAVRLSTPLSSRRADQAHSGSSRGDSLNCNLPSPTLPDEAGKTRRNADVQPVLEDCVTGPIPWPSSQQGSIERDPPVCVQKLMVDDAAPAAPSSGGTDSINIPAVVGAVVAAVVVLVVAVLLTTRRRRGHNFQRDAWGLPINPVVRPPALHCVPSSTPSPHRQRASAAPVAQVRIFFRRRAGALPATFAPAV